jgi:mono/diheme cytochrome c family protein
MRCYDQNMLTRGLEQMAPCLAYLARGLIAGLLVCLSLTANAADSSQLSSRGKVILQQNCGRCHAIEAVGDSPLKQAPPMRDVYARFDPRELQAELREGMVSKHRAMPQIDFSDEDVDAILAYLYALAVKK